jgi:hypothetical protein
MTPTWPAGSVPKPVVVSPAGANALLPTSGTIQSGDTRAGSEKSAPPMNAAVSPRLRRPDAGDAPRVRARLAG